MKAIWIFFLAGVVAGLFLNLDFLVEALPLFAFPILTLGIILLAFSVSKPQIERMHK